MSKYFKSIYEKVDLAGKEYHTSAHNVFGGGLENNNPDNDSGDLSEDAAVTSTPTSLAPDSPEKGQFQMRGVLFKRDNGKKRSFKTEYVRVADIKKLKDEDEK